MITIIYIYLVPSNFRLIIYITNISYDIQVDISTRLILKLEKMLHMCNISFCILLPDCTGEPKHVAEKTSTYCTNIVLYHNGMST